MAYRVLLAVKGWLLRKVGTERSSSEKRAVSLQEFVRGVHIQRMFVGRLQLAGKEGRAAAVR